MKAIHTRFAGPTNTRGARIITRAEGCKSRTMSYPYGARDAHRDAAADFAIALGWYGTYASATLPDGSQAHVPVMGEAGGTSWSIRIGGK